MLSPLLRIPVKNSLAEDIESNSSDYENSDSDNKDTLLAPIVKRKFNHRSLMKMPPARSLSILTHKSRGFDNSSKNSKY